MIEDAPASPRRRWFRYSLRTFFVLLTMLCVWLGVQVKWISDRHEAVRDDPDAFVDIETKAPWSIRLLGERGQFAIVVGSGHSEEEYSRLKSLFPEATTGVIPGPRRKN